jgi:RNA polymerase sigma factor (sigma-70 family)
MPSDAELLQLYVEHHDDQAFTALLQRYLSLVYSAACRRTAGRRHIAEEVTQRVFCDLARKARFLQSHPALPAWLHRSTRYLAIDALRAELRHKKVNEAFAIMNDPSQQDEAVDVAGLRPVIDTALDELNDRDREVVLLRYFGELTFPEIARRLQLSESAARMRAERALEKLRLKLQRRGLTSTSAALGLALANQALATSAPAGLMASALSASLSLPPMSGAGAVITFLSMNKIITPLLSAAVAAGLTTLAWTSAASTVSDAELTELRDKNVQLAAAVAPGAHPALAREIVSAHEGRLGATTAALEKQIESRRSTTVTAATASGASATGDIPAKGHRNHGLATPKDAWMTFAWAADSSDSAMLARMIWMDPPARKKAEEILAGMPAAVRERFHTPEELYGFFYAADALIAPRPDVDVVSSFELVEIAPGRYAARRPGSSKNFHELQQTPEGWKDVLPLNGVIGMAHTLENPGLAKLGQH